MNDSDHLWPAPTIDQTAKGEAENWVAFVRLKLRELEERIAELERGTGGGNGPAPERVARDRGEQTARVKGQR